MKKLIVFVAVLIMSIIFIPSNAQATNVVERQVTLILKCYGDGTGDFPNTTGKVFTLTTKEIISRLSLYTNEVFSSNATLIIRQTITGDDVPGQLGTSQFFVRDNGKDVPIADEILQFNEIVGKFGKTSFVEGIGGAFTLYSLISYNFKVNDDNCLALIGMMVDKGKWTLSSLGAVPLYDSSANVSGYLSLDGIFYVVEGTFKMTGARIIY